MICRWKLKLDSQGKPVWVCVPVLIRIQKPWPPDDLRGWFHDARVNPEILQDFSILATMDELAAGLSGAIKSQVQTSLEKAAHLHKMPAHLELEIDDERR